MSDEFVDVYARTTGQKVFVPAEWMDNPVISAGFRRTPSTREEEGPFDGYTVEQLRTYAGEHHVDVTGLTRKGDFIAAITAPTIPPSGEQE